MEVELHTFFTVKLDGDDEWAVLRGHFTPGPTWLEGQADHVVCPNALELRKISCSSLEPNHYYNSIVI